MDKEKLREAVQIYRQTEQRIRELQADLVRIKLDVIDYLVDCQCHDFLTVNFQKLEKWVNR